MKQKTDTVSDGPAKRIEAFGLHIFELIDSNIQKQDLGSTYIKLHSDIGMMNAVISSPPPLKKLLTCWHVPALSTVPPYEFYRHVNKSKRFF